jgi:hypothetical protein
MLPTCLKAAGTGVELLVQVVPNASRTACAGLHDGALRLRLMAPPVDGRANAVLLVWLADQLGLAQRAVTLVSGDTRRRKRVHIDATTAQVAAWVQAQLSDAGV